MDLSESIVYVNGLLALTSVSLYWFKHKASCEASINKYIVYAWSICGLLFGLFAMYCALGMRIFGLNGGISSTNSVVSTLQRISAYGLVANTRFNEYLVLIVSLSSIIYMVLNLYMLYVFRSCLDRNGKCNRLYDCTLASLMLYAGFVVIKSRGLMSVT